MSVNAVNTAILNLIYCNIDLADIGDAAGLQNSTTAGSLYIAFHTATPGDAGAQNANECDYTNYARVAVARSAVGWTVSGDNVSNAAAIEFPEAGVGTADVATHASIGFGSTGATKILRYFELDVPLTISQGVQPIFKIGELDTDISEA